MAAKRKRVDLDLNAKMDILKQVDENVKMKDIAHKFGIDVSTVSKLVKNREKIERGFHASLDCKRMRTSSYVHIECALLNWFNLTRSVQLPVSGPMLAEIAERFAKEMDMPDWKCSNGFIERFKKRHNISFKKKRPLHVVPQCCAVCSSRSDTDPQLHFFSFPSDEERQSIWALNCGLEPDSIGAASWVCERHFSNGQFVNSRTKDQLLEGATPRTFDFHNQATEDDDDDVGDYHQWANKRVKIEMPEDASIGLNSELSSASVSNCDVRTYGRLPEVKVEPTDDMESYLLQPALPHQSVLPQPVFTPTIESIIQSAKQLGMRDLMAEFFEEQLRRCLRDKEVQMSSSHSSATPEAAVGESVRPSHGDASSLKAKAVIQQCCSAKLMVKPATEASPDLYVQINRGIVVFVCFLQGATSETVKKLAKTVLNIRLSETKEGKLVSILDLPGEVLIVPQATLGGRIKGNMMQYHKNIEKELGEKLYDEFVVTCQQIVEKNNASIEHGCCVNKGTYGNRQVLTMETNGPYTHIIEI